MSNEMKKEKKKILILAANPKTTPRVRLDEEIREIEEGLQRSKQRDLFEIEAHLALRLRDLRRALLDNEPAIVHFTGHGEKDGLILEDETGLAVSISAKALSGLFALFAGKVECVILSACYSAPQAKAIAKHIPYVIGMRKKIKDRAAIEFAIGFYDALGAGRTVEDAVKFGSNAILQKFPDSSDHLIPRLIKKGIKGKRKGNGNTFAGSNINNIHRDKSTNDRPVTLAIRSIKHPAHHFEDEVDEMLCLCDHFQDRQLVNGTWEDINKEIQDFVSRTLKAGYRYQFYLPLHTSLAFLLGRTIDTKLGAEINIFQQSPSSSFELWKLNRHGDSKSYDSWIVEEAATGNPGKELAAALSVSQPIRQGVETYVKNCHARISHLIHLALTVANPRSFIDEGHAYEASHQAAIILRDACGKMEASGLNLFLAAPNVFTFMLGQQSLVLLKNITLYEFDPESGDSGKYTPAFTISQGNTIAG
jgi:hypothetical protein